MVIDRGPIPVIIPPDDAISRTHAKMIAEILRSSPRMKHFVWGLTYPWEESVLEALQTSCINLRTFECFMVNNHLDAGSEYLQVFGLQNLEYLRLEISESGAAFEDTQVKRLSYLLRACPRIKHIELVLNETTSKGTLWSPEELLSHLSDINFPHLHTFRLLGPSVNPNWTTFFDPSSDSPLRKFFLSHPGLTNVGLGWAMRKGNANYANLTDVANIFQSVVEFEAPSFVCAVVIASELASQLESISLTDSHDYHYSRLQLQRVAESVKPLPKLRKLALNFYHTGSETMSEVEDLFKFTPYLEDLKLEIPFDDPVGSSVCFIGMGPDRLMVPLGFGHTGASPFTEPQNAEHSPVCSRPNGSGYRGVWMA
ncbi:F-box-like domain protein [Ceratobasidium sp. AG-Ba]|nr:F-box-like domain protein [Ceratobasidium sp. AG-Ba]